MGRDDNKENVNLTTRITIVERDVDRFMEFTTKLEDTISRLTEIASAVKQMLAVHDIRLTNIESDASDARKALENHRDEIKEINKALSARITELERWRWYLIGAAIGLGPLLQLLTSKLRLVL